MERRELEWSRDGWAGTWQYREDLEGPWRIDEARRYTITDVEGGYAVGVAVFDFDNTGMTLEECQGYDGSRWSDECPFVCQSLPAAQAACATHLDQGVWRVDERQRAAHSKSQSVRTGSSHPKRSCRSG